MHPKIFRDPIGNIWACNSNTFKPASSVIHKIILILNIRSHKIDNDTKGSKENTGNGYKSLI